jgi:hypothetical protein
MSLQLRNSKTVFGRWLFNPAVTPGKIRASNLQSAKKFPNPLIRAAFRLHPLEKALIQPNLSAPFSAAPEQLVASRYRNGAQEIQREGWEGEKVTAAVWGMDSQ